MTRCQLLVIIVRTYIRVRIGHDLISFWQSLLYSRVLMVLESAPGWARTPHFIRSAVDSITSMLRWYSIYCAIERCEGKWILTFYGHYTEQDELENIWWQSLMRRFCMARRDLNTTLVAIGVYMSCRRVCYAVFGHISPLVLASYLESRRRATQST